MPEVELFRLMQDPLDETLKGVRAGLERADLVMPYLEAGVGIHGMTDTELEDKNFDTEIAFGSHGGAGIRFGHEGQYEIGYRYQHLSNLGIGDSNPGINFHLVRLSYHF